jgi:hypothetical protein
MKKVLLILLVLGLVAALGYLVGTDDGRTRRDELLSRARKKSADVAEPGDD